jgi:type I restriction enzyme, R subunit
MSVTASESTFEQATIERLQLLGYRYCHGTALNRPLQSVVLVDELRRHLQQRYRQLPPAAIEQAIETVRTPEGFTLDRRNLTFQRLLREGLTVRYEEERQEKFAHLYLADFEQPERNDFLVVNQLTIEGGESGNRRRPDLVIYINGLPLVVFELKSPWDEYADVAGAHNQIGHYMLDIPQLFTFNGFCVVSDGNTTLHGTYNGDFEWYAPWKSIDGHTVEANTTGSMKALIEGLFPKPRLLDYLRNFLVHEVVNDKITKKGARYHQFFAVRFAAQKAAESLRPATDKRVGVVWHTQGSGKSLSMIFLTGILRRWPSLNPTILVQVDRNDLDNQLYESFVAAKELVGTVHQANTVEDLRQRLQTTGGEVICTTIEKFRLTTGEQTHPVLSPHDNILVIADEAHRTQYGLTTDLSRTNAGTLSISQGFALNLRQALPNAAFIGFTGTPIDQEDANTTQLFGDYIHIYDMYQAREDKAVVGLFYEPRHVPLNLANTQIDADLAAITEEIETTLPIDRLERAKLKWAAVERAAGAQERLSLLAEDLLQHFTTRQKVLKGKAMAVCMSRRNCVTLYNTLTTLPDCPEVKIVMTGNLATDPKAWSEVGHITTKARHEEIKARFVDSNDPLKLVIVCDMWLTGFDAPCVNTLYVDKPMQGHNLMQAIARVNRIFKDKPAGLIVDYIGISDQLREATHKYTSSGGRGDLTEELTKQAVNTFLHQLEITRALLPPSQPYTHWRSLSALQLDDLTSLCYGTLAGDESLKEDFLHEEHRLSKAYSLIYHLPTGQQHSDEVTFCQMIRNQVRKLSPKGQRNLEDLDRAVQDLLDASIEALPAVDIFKVAGLEKPDISILDDEFLVGFKGQQHPDLQVRLLHKLMLDDLNARRRHNLMQVRSFRHMLEETITRYNNNTLQAADVVRVMVEIRQQQQANEQRKRNLGLSDEELAFYDVIALGAREGLPTDNEWIASLVRDVVKAVKGNLKVDWTRSHRRDVYASVESAVKMVLRRRQVKGEQFSFILNRLMNQAEALYIDWPLAA